MPLRHSHLCLLGLIAIVTAAVQPGLARAVPAHDVGARKQRPGHSDEHASAEHRRRARAEDRRRLAALVRRNPKALLQRSFIKRAQVDDFSLPITVRLNPVADGTVSPPTFQSSDDSLQISWDPTTTGKAWPAPTDLQAGVSWAPPAPVTTTLSGGFAMEINFNADTSGYGALGILETTQGQQTSLQATPFAISDFDPSCASGPALQVQPGTTVQLISGGMTFGALDLVHQTAAGSLHLYAALSAERTETCDATANTYAPTGLDDSRLSPIVVTFYGEFHLSPAITADGRLRLGKLNVDGSVVPQQSSFSYIHACTSTTLSTCNDVAFPARITLEHLTADLLVGSAPT